MEFTVLLPIVQTENLLAQNLLNKQNVKYKMNARLIVGHFFV